MYKPNWFITELALILYFGFSRSPTPTHFPKLVAHKNDIHLVRRDVKFKRTFKFRELDSRSIFFQIMGHDVILIEYHIVLHNSMDA